MIRDGTEAEKNQFVLAESHTGESACLANRENDWTAQIDRNLRPIHSPQFYRVLWSVNGLTTPDMLSFPQLVWKTAHGVQSVTKSPAWATSEIFGWPRKRAIIVPNFQHIRRRPRSKRQTKIFVN